MMKGQENWWGGVETVQDVKRGSLRNTNLKEDCTLKYEPTYFVTLDYRFAFLTITDWNW